MSSLTSVDFDALSRKALHTLWQSFFAVLSVTWVASGIDVSEITDEASAKKVAVAAVSAVVAAFYSAVKSTAVSLFAPPSTVGRNGSSGVGPLADDKPRPAPYAGKHEIVAPESTQTPTAGA